MDLQLAAYKLKKFQFRDPPVSLKEIFPRKRIKMLPDSRGTLDLIAKQLRDSTWRRAESQQKQLQFHLNREKYNQVKTWQQEYDNLTTVLPRGRQPYVLARMEELRKLMSVPTHRPPPHLIPPPNPPAFPASPTD